MPLWITSWWNQQWRDTALVVDSPLSVSEARRVLIEESRRWTSLFAIIFSGRIWKRAVIGRFYGSSIRLCAAAPGFGNSWRPVFRG
ncbi:MAG TPA: hypothetical protein VEJ87_09980, partial [Acidimicrobiales bacterium]|nr:hypothetical protein [Acidimicrobiales bacterium]